MKPLKSESTCGLCRVENVFQSSAPVGSGQRCKDGFRWHRRDHIVALGTGSKGGIPSQVLAHTDTSDDVCDT
jgi:hypothetical protein